MVERGCTDQKAKKSCRRRSVGEAALIDAEGDEKL
jgi:hypothetical protein